MNITNLMKKQLRLLQLSVVLYLVTNSATGWAYDEHNTFMLPPNNTIEENQLHLFFNAEYFTVSANKVRISGIGASSGFIYGLQKHWGFHGQLAQAYSSKDKFATFYTALSVGLSYSLMGRLIHRQSKVLLNNYETIYSKETALSDLVIHLKINQYYMNTSTLAVPYSGVGVDIVYQFPLFGSWPLSVRLGGGADRVTSTKQTLVPIHGILGLSYYPRF